MFRTTRQLICSLMIPLAISFFAASVFAQNDDDNDSLGGSTLDLTGSDLPPLNDLPPLPARPAPTPDTIPDGQLPTPGSLEGNLPPTPNSSGSNLYSDAPPPAGRLRDRGYDADGNYAIPARTGLRAAASGASGQTVYTYGTVPDSQRGDDGGSDNVGFGGRYRNWIGVNEEIKARDLNALNEAYDFLGHGDDGRDADDPAVLRSPGLMSEVIADKLEEDGYMTAPSYSEYRALQDLYSVQHGHKELTPWDHKYAEKICLGYFQAGEDEQRREDIFSQSNPTELNQNNKNVWNMFEQWSDLDRDPGSTEGVLENHGFALRPTPAVIDAISTVRDAELGQQVGEGKLDRAKFVKADYLKQNEKAVRRNRRSEAKFERDRENREDKGKEPMRSPKRDPERERERERK